MTYAVISGAGDVLVLVLVMLQWEVTRKSIIGCFTEQPAL